MKELLYTATGLLLLYCLLNNKSISSIVIIVTSVIILLIHMSSFKMKYKENFVTTSIVPTELYNNEDYNEILPDTIKNDLVYYVSSFDKNI